MSVERRRVLQGEREGTENTGLLARVRRQEGGLAVGGLRRAHGVWTLTVTAAIGPVSTKGQAS